MVAHSAIKRIHRALICLSLLFVFHSACGQSAAQSSADNQMQPSSFECYLSHHLKVDMSLEEVKQQVGSRYAPLMRLVGKVYGWDVNTGEFIGGFELGIYDNGSFEHFSAIGVAVPAALSKSIDNRTITLQEAQRVLGEGKLVGYIYELRLTGQKRITICTSTNNMVRGLSFNFSCL